MCPISRLWLFGWGETFWEAGGKGCSSIPGEIHIIRSAMAMDQHPFMHTLSQTWSRDAVAEEDFLPSQQI